MLKKTKILILDFFSPTQDEIERKGSILVDYKDLLSNKQISHTLPDLAKDLKEMPEKILDCLGVAIHQVGFVLCIYRCDCFQFNIMPKSNEIIESFSAGADCGSGETRSRTAGAGGASRRRTAHNQHPTYQRQVRLFTCLYEYQIKSNLFVHFSLFERSFTERHDVNVYNILMPYSCI